jgi:hypothetical protein
MSLQFDQLNNQLRVNDASNANAPIVLQASGTGATQAQLADSTATGGNARGTHATDWQKARSSAIQVASANYSVICGGQNNRTNATHSTVVGGQDNTTNSQYAFVGSGANNTASGTGSAVVAGGFDFGGAPNTASGYGSFIGAGISNTSSGKNAGIVSGDSNGASGLNSFIGAGRNNSADASTSAILGGSYGTTRSIIGNQVSPACLFPVSQSLGISQSALLILGVQTTDATATILRSNTAAAGTTNQVILPNNSAYYFKGRIIAGVTGAGNTAAWTFEGAIKRGANAAATSIVGTINTALVAQDAGASTWSFTATADTTNGGLTITVTGQASTTIRWVCKIETTEMTY